MSRLWYWVLDSWGNALVELGWMFIRAGMWLSGYDLTTWLKQDSPTGVK